MKSDYPKIKIIIGFTLCPALAGFFIGLGMILEMLILSFSNGENKFILLAGLVVIPIVSGVMGLLLFGIPAFIAAVLYAQLKLYSIWYNYLLVFLIGGFVSQSWSLIIMFGVKEEWRVTNISFGLGAILSLVVAYFLLPKKSMQSKNNKAT